MDVRNSTNRGGGNDPFGGAPVEIASKEFGKVFFSVIQFNHFDDKNPNFIGGLLRELDEVGCDAKTLMELEIVLIFIYTVALMDKVVKENRDVEQLTEEIRSELKVQYDKFMKVMTDSEKITKMATETYGLRLNRYFSFLEITQATGPLFYVAKEFYLNKSGKKEETMSGEELKRKCTTITNYLMRSQRVATETLRKFKIAQ